MNVLPDVYSCSHRKKKEEEYTSSSLGDGKMYTSVSIANSQRMQAERNKSGTKAKIKI